MNSPNSDKFSHSNMDENVKLVLILTSNADELSRGTNTDDPEQP